MTFVAALILLVPFGTYLLTSVLYKFRLRKSSGCPPSVPYVIPIVAHTSTFARGSDILAGSLRQNAAPGAAVRFKGVGFNFVLLSGSNFIKKALSAADRFDWNTISAPLFGSMFGGPEKIVDALRQDDSGIGVKPYPGSNVHPGRRLLRNQILFLSEAFSRSSLDEMVPRFVSNLESMCSEISKEEWLERSDLYDFIRDVLFKCGVDSFFGPSMLELNPNLSQVFWEYDDNIGFLATGMPEWMNPKVIRARTACLESMKRWRKTAIENTDPNTPDDAAWDPAWGLGAMRRRNKLLDNTEGLFDEDGKASIDLALIWSLTSNVIPASFWYLYEILASPGLVSCVRSEIKKETADPSEPNTHKFDATRLTNNALLQYIYAETLRLHVVTLVTRTVKQPHSINSWELPKGQNIIVSSHVEHMDKQWDSPDKTHTAEEFWPDRFLVENEQFPSTKKFSLDGRQGQWIPFGLGEHMCPGRHFAKQEMILNAAVMLTFFEFELLTPVGWRLANDFSRYGFGSQKPKEKVPFRIRRRGKA